MFERIISIILNVCCFIYVDLKASVKYNQSSRISAINNFIRIAILLMYFSCITWVNDY